MLDLELVYFASRARSLCVFAYGELRRQIQRRLETSFSKVDIDEIQNRVTFSYSRSVRSTVETQRADCWSESSLLVTKSPQQYDCEYFELPRQNWKN